MKIPLFRASHMEPAVEELDRQFDRVMVRAIHYLDKPIRLRVKMLQDIRPFYLRNDPAFDREIDRWNEENGTLINFRPWFRNERVLPHDATFICECPLSMDEIEAQARDAGKICVVYPPPTWRAHLEDLFYRFPPATLCKRFFQTVSKTKPDKHLLSIALACSIPTAGTYAIDDAILAADFDNLNVVRKRTMKSKEGRRWSTVLQLIPRIEPEDRTLLGMYQHIKNELPVIGHVRLARDNALVKAARFWKIALRALVRSGSVEQKAKIGFYFMDGLEPDYLKISADHEAAKARFNQLKAQVDALPEFRALPRQSPKSSAPAQPESGAHARDTGR